jgi:hypothetical protein
MSVFIAKFLSRSRSHTETKRLLLVVRRITERKFCDLHGVKQKEKGIETHR